MEKQSELQIDAMQCKFDLEGKLWIKVNQSEWQEAAFVLQTQGAESAIKKALAKVKVVWVPTEQVTLIQQFVPGRRKQDWLNALPYALEESLAEPVEGLHFVALNRNSAGLVDAAVVSKARMLNWVEQLQEMQLDHALLVADCFQVELNPAVTVADSESQSQQAWSVYQDGTQRHLVRTGEYAGFAGSAQWYQQLKQIATQSGGDIATQTVTRLTDSCHINQISSRNPCQAFNLRVGEFPVRSQQSGTWLRLKWPVVLLLLLLIVYLVGLHLQTEQHRQQAQAYQSQTEALFKERFPEVKRIVNIQVQAKARFAGESPAGSVQSGPSQLARQLEGVFKKYPSIKIKRLDWKASSAQLAVHIQSAQVAALQNLLNEVKQTQSAELKVNNVSQTLAEGVLYVDAN